MSFRCLANGRTDHWCWVLRIFAAFLASSGVLGVTSNGDNPIIDKEILPMKKAMFAVAALVLSTTASAADTLSLSTSCIGLDEPGMKLCMDIIARTELGAFAPMRALTLAEKTAINAIMAADSKAVVVILPDGSFVIGHSLGDRLIGIPCTSNPCK
jgi:hypothetical protein